MLERRGSRFALEVVFLLALMGALMLTDLGPLPIAGVMLAGWLIAAAFEWAAARGEAHYGSGLPPRYYVPQVSLPPARPLEQVGGYPEQRDEAPTWIASAAMREELLGEWPVATYAEDEQAEPPAAGETTEDADAEGAPPDDSGFESTELERAGLDSADLDSAAPAELALPADAEVAAEAALPEEPEPEVELTAPTELELDTAERAEALPEVTDSSEELAADPAAPAATGFAPWQRGFWRRRTAAPDEIAEPPADEELSADVEREESAVAPAPAPAAEPEPEPESEPEPQEPAPEPALVAADTTAKARHSLDPLAEPERGRRPWQRSGEPEVPTVEVVARPAAGRPLPQHATAGRADRED